MTRCSLPATNQSPTARQAGKDTVDNGMPDGDFSGRRVLLVGTGGIGGAIADRLAADGARLFGTYPADGP